MTIDDESQPKAILNVFDMLDKAFIIKGLDFDGLFLSISFLRLKTDILGVSEHRSKSFELISVDVEVLNENHNSQQKLS